MTKTIRALMLSAAALLGAACTDAPSAPAAPSLEVVNPMVTASVLRRTTPLAGDITRSITLYQQGGTLSIPEAGFHLNIPRTAIGNSRVTITVTALKGYNVAYVFGPHGMQFKSPIRMTQSFENTTLSGNVGNTPLEGGYFLDRTYLSETDGTALVQEFIPVTVQATGNRMHMDIRHFSGYLVATGRR